MRKDKIKAYELRRKGKSYSEISATLKVSKGTLSEWFKNEEWSNKIKENLSSRESLSNPKKLAQMQKSARARWESWRQSYRDEALAEFDKLKDDPLFIAGVTLYWAEGSRTGHLKLSSSDPAVLSLFSRFLSVSIGTAREKILAYLLLYPDLADEPQRRFWSVATNIPLQQFRKSIYIAGRSPKKRLSYGVCNIYVNSSGLREKMLVWIELLSKSLARG